MRSRRSKTLLYLDRDIFVVIFAYGVLGAVPTF